MKKIFPAILLLSALSVVAINTKTLFDWKIVEQAEKDDLPTTALHLTDSLMHLADATGSEADLLLGFSYKVRNSLLLDAETADELIASFQTFADSLHHPVLRSIAHSQLAEAYSALLDFRYSELVTLKGSGGVAIDSWTVADYLKAIFSSVDSSLTSVDLLGASSVKEFSAFFSTNDSDWLIFPPTVYDVLADVAFRLYDDYRLPRYINSTPRSSSVNLGQRRELLFNQLLSFHSSRANTSAIIYYSVSHYTKKGEYAQLDSLIDHYPNEPAIVEAIAHTLRHRMVVERDSLDRDGIIAICDDAISRFPSYARIAQLKNIKSEIRQIALSIEVKKSYHPKEKILLKVRTTNVESFQLTVYRLDQSALTPMNYGVSDSRKKTRRLSTVYSSTLDSSTDRLFLPDLPLGFYQFVARPIGSSGDDETVGTFHVTRFASLLSYTPKGEIAVYDQQTGHPLKGVSVGLYKEKSGALQSIKQLVTDKEGVVRLNSSLRCDYFQVRAGEDISSPFCRIFTPYISRNRESDPPNVGLFTDRAVYRSGQRVAFKGIVWNASRDKMKALVDRSVKVSLYDANGKEIGSVNAESNRLGSFSGEFLIPKDRLSGTFSLRTSLGGYVQFEVAEYKRPTFEVVLSASDSEIALGSPLTYKGRVKSYTAVPVANVDVRYSIKRKDDLLRYYHLSTSETVGEGVVTTDKEGIFAISFVPEQSVDVPRNYYYTLTVECTNAAGETQSTSHSTHVTSHPYTLTIHAPERIDRSADAAVRFSAVRSNGSAVDVVANFEIVSLSASPEVEELFSSAPFESKELNVVKRGELKSSALLDAQIWKSLEIGKYRLKLSTDQSVLAQHDFVIYSSDRKQLPYVVGNFFVGEDRSYAVGEPITLLLGSSFSNVNVALEVYKEGLCISRSYLPLSAELKKIELPYKEEYGDEVMIVLRFIRHGTLFVNRVHSHRKVDQLGLTIRSNTFRSELLPDSKERWSFSLLDSNGAVLEAEMMATMYDASLDAIKGMRWIFAPTIQRLSSLPIHEGYGLGMHLFSPYYSYQLLPVPNIDLPIVRSLGFDNLYSSNAYKRMFRSSLATTRAKEMISEEDAVTFESAYAGKGPAPMLNPNTKEEAQVLRSNLVESCFFFPHLMPDRKGEMVLDFKVPQTLTRWNVKMLAHTPDMRYATLDTTVVTSKRLMVTPHLPRFLTKGDSIVLTAQVSNPEKYAQKARVSWSVEALDETSGATPLDLHAEYDLMVDANGSTVTSYVLKAPYDGASLKVTIKASSSLHSDGEERIIPLVSNRVDVVETQPFTIDKAGSTTLPLKRFSDKSITGLSASVEVLAQPYLMAVEALPTMIFPQSNDAITLLKAFYSATVVDHILASNPLLVPLLSTASSESTHSLLDKSTPFLEHGMRHADRQRNLQLLLNENDRQAQRNVLIGRIKDLCIVKEGWSWLPGMKSSVFVSVEVLKTLTRLQALDAYEPDESITIMMMDAFRYLDSYFLDFDRHPIRIFVPSRNEYLAIRSFHRDIPIDPTLLPRHKELIANLEAGWKSASLSQKAQIARTLYNYGNQKEALRIVQSVKEYATHSATMGMFWANNRSNYSSASAIAVHAELMETILLLNPKDPDVDAMKLWLLRQKQTQMWGSPSATVDALYALLLRGSNELERNSGVIVSYEGRSLISTVDNSNQLRAMKLSSPLPAEALTSPRSLSFDKKESGALFGSVYYTYEQDVNTLKPLSTSLLIRKSVSAAAEGGRRRSVRLTVTTDRDMDYIRIADNRSANWEPVEHLSRMKWNGRVGYYQEITDGATNIFIEHLPRGTHHFEYDIFLTHEGDMQPGLTVAESLYSPEFRSSCVMK